MEGTIEIRHEPLAGPIARALVAALDAELSSTYPEPGATHFRLDVEEIERGGAFLVVFADGKPVGCGAFRRLSPTTAELKRMYVARSSRGRGLGARLLEALEAEARKVGVTRLVLETGTRQTEALGLYARAGFRAIQPFGEYEGSPLSVCLAKSLV